MLLTSKLPFPLQSDIWYASHLVTVPIPAGTVKVSGVQRVQGNLNLVVRAGEVE